MTRACWAAVSDGSYWIDFALGATPGRFMLDTGFTDKAGQVAFDLDSAVYDALEQTGQLLSAGTSKRRDASGQQIRLPIGFVVARLIDPVSGSLIGPPVRCLAVRNFAGVPSRVGVVFFHLLTNCRADWDFDKRLWCVECP